MKKMGLNMSSLDDVEEVIIKKSDRDLIIKDPQVSVINMQGQKIFQIAGEEIIERELEKEKTIPLEDIQLVAQQANVATEKAKNALEQTDGNLAQAILLLSQK